MSSIERANELPAPTRPDKITIWPVSDEAFGLDATYRGSTGYKRAETIIRQLIPIGLKAQLNQECDQAWTVRFGPIPREQMLMILNGYVW